MLDSFSLESKQGDKVSATRVVKRKAVGFNPRSPA
jgi:hypothetical protein